ncbi:hypothetical protein L3X38_039702 [Prunus dulcis]|uniref:Uncharacterized protein n=1 Tax=Prunus dulcis TaxID=3755 RepID=A0AAD4V7M4_PRUDU|nr:hypothetical protein L3X38_039702 [Prunus dulcis]
MENSDSDEPEKKRPHLNSLSPTMACSSTPLLHPITIVHSYGNLDEAFWELTGFGVVGTPKLSELEAGAIPGWVTTLGSCFVSSQKQNRAGW